jgi:hypothetical protein
MRIDDLTKSRHDVDVTSDPLIREVHLIAIGEKPEACTSDNHHIAVPRTSSRHASLADVSVQPHRDLWLQGG